jgi:hypothetical protein
MGPPDHTQLYLRKLPQRAFQALGAKLRRGIRRNIVTALRMSQIFRNSLAICI